MYVKEMCHGWEPMAQMRKMTFNINMLCMCCNIFF